jgi:hypothetical protein
MNHEAVQDWLKVRRHLLEMETSFTDLAIRVAAGEETEEALQERRRMLEATRSLCSAAYARAFPQRLPGA